DLRISRTRRLHLWSHARLSSHDRPARIGGHEASGRDLYVAVVDELRDWPAEIELPVPPFVVLTALDTAGASTEELRKFAGKVLDQGGCYATAWGDATYPARRRRRRSGSSRAMVSRVVTEAVNRLR